jgi:CDP-diacylglycerol--serine O-phosphatidyltransferase
MPARVRRRPPFFRKRKYTANGDDFADRPRRKKIPIKEMKKGIFILPSLLTVTSIFFSFYSVIESIQGQFWLAACLILVAGFFDGIDGRVARWTKTTSRFGLELDSLADVISFGMAPAVLMYVWALAPHGRIGWVSAFLFVACGALRLARFNVQSGTIDPKRFNGLPIPAAAAMVATTVLFFEKAGLQAADYAFYLMLLTLLLSFFMVSSVKFHAFKDLTWAKQKPFSSTVAFVLLLALIAAAPTVVPFFLCSAYLISGPILTIWLYRNRKKIQEKAAEEPQPTQEIPALEQNPKS